MGAKIPIINGKNLFLTKIRETLKTFVNGELVEVVYRKYEDGTFDIFNAWVK
jgi:hypothetical protein